VARHRRILNAVLERQGRDLTYRGSNKVAKRIMPANCGRRISYSAWACADPGIQFHSTINDWHNLPGGRRHPRLQSVLGIHVPGRHGCTSPRQPDDLPQGARRRRQGVRRRFVEHAVRLWTVVLEISVLMAQFRPRKSRSSPIDYRTLGLGFANIGGLLMAAGISYDSREGRAIAGAISAVMTGVSYATSAEMAGELGPFPEYAANKDAMLRVMRNHRRAAHGEAAGYEGLSTPPVPLDLMAVTNKELAFAAQRAWDDAVSLGEASATATPSPP